MVSISLLLFTLLLAYVNASENSASTSWTKLNISPVSLCSMPYGNFRVNIYESSQNHLSTTIPSQKMYFYAPIALLDHKSAASEFNNVTKQSEIRFRIEMWNDDVDNKVADYLSKFIGHEIKSHQVQVIPFEKVVLVTSKPSTIYSLITDWHPYQLEKSLWFTLTCFQQNDCNQLEVIMHENPTKLGHLKLQFGLSSQTTQAKQIDVLIESIVSGQMVIKLLQRSVGKKEALLTDEDLSQLLSEMTTNVIMEAFDELDVVAPNSQLQIHKTLEDLIVTSKTTITNKQEKIWEWLFWMDDNYRPDKSAKKLKEIYDKQEKLEQKKMSDAYKNINSASIGGNVAGGDFGALIDLTREGISKEDIDKLYQKSKDYIEWDGQTFVPKPMSLSRINLGKLRDWQYTPELSMKVRYMTAMFSTPIRFVQSYELLSTDEWTELRTSVVTLQREVQELQMKLEDSLTTDVSFHARTHSLAASKEIETNQNLPYEVITLNKGDGLNKTTGVFTAPNSGTYLFTFHGMLIAKGIKSQTLMALIKLNGKTMTTVYNHYSFLSHVARTSGMAIILFLNVEDEVAVYIESDSETKTCSVMLTSFSGVLLREKKR